MDAAATPSFAEVLDARASRVAMVRDYLATVTTEELASERVNPWGGTGRPTVLDCLRVICKEEWHHHRFAVRDLDAIESYPSSGNRV